MRQRAFPELSSLSLRALVGYTWVTAPFDVGEVGQQYRAYEMLLAGQHCDCLAAAVFGVLKWLRLVCLV